MSQYTLDSRKASAGLEDLPFAIEVNVYAKTRLGARGTVTVGGARGYGSQAHGAHSQEETGSVLNHQLVSSVQEGPIYLFNALTLATDGYPGCTGRRDGQLAQGGEQARVAQSPPQLHTSPTSDSTASAYTET